MSSEVLSSRTAEEVGVLSLLGVCGGLRGRLTLIRAAQTASGRSHIARGSSRANAAVHRPRLKRSRSDERRRPRVDLLSTSELKVRVLRGHLRFESTQADDVLRPRSFLGPNPRHPVGRPNPSSRQDSKDSNSIRRRGWAKPLIIGRPSVYGFLGSDRFGPSRGTASRRAGPPRFRTHESTWAVAEERRNGGGRATRSRSTATVIVHRPVATNVLRLMSSWTTRRPDSHRQRRRTSRDGVAGRGSRPLDRSPRGRGHRAFQLGAEHGRASVVGRKEDGRGRGYVLHIETPGGHEVFGAGQRRRVGEYCVVRRDC
jgi:hypothetical protein